jgi:hypothetical protein
MKKVLPPETVELKSIEIKLKRLERQESRLLWLSCASILLALVLLLVYKNELAEEPINKEYRPVEAAGKVSHHFAKKSPKLQLQADFTEN